MVSAITGGAYSQQWEARTTIKIQIYPRNQLWIDLNTDTAEWMNHGEQLIIVGDWNSEVSEVRTWMKIQVIPNAICDLYR